MAGRDRKEQRQNARCLVARDEVGESLHGPITPAAPTFLTLTPNKEKMKLVAAMQYLYSHEINCCIRCLWDGGWNVSLGDSWNGYSHSVVFDNHELEEAGDWLLKIAKEQYPNLPMPITTPEHS